MSLLHDNELNDASAAYPMILPTLITLKSEFDF